MAPILLVLISLAGASVDGPIEELYQFAEQQEAYLRELRSYSAEIRHVREKFAINPHTNERMNIVTHGTIRESTVVGGARFLERMGETRIYQPGLADRTTKKNFAYLLLRDMVAEFYLDEAAPCVRVKRFVPDGELARDTERTLNLMNPRDILVHGFGDGNRTLRALCDALVEEANDHKMRIERTLLAKGIVQYAISKDGRTYEEIELDPEHLGMITAVRLYLEENDSQPVLEVLVNIGQLPGGKFFPTLWCHIAYDVADGQRGYRRYVHSTRNELHDIEFGAVDPSDVSFHRFGVPDGTLAIIQFDGSDDLKTGRIEGGELIEAP